MKKIIILLTGILYLLPLKSQLTFTSSAQVVSYLNGDWFWIRSCGGLTGTCSYPATTGYVRHLNFNPLSSATDSVWYKLVQNTTLLNLQAVKISTNSIQYPGNWTLEDVLTQGNTPLSLSIVQAKTDTVWLSENCADCYDHQYLRVKTVGLPERVEPETELLVYPNPATDKIVVSAAGKVIRLWIIDVTGRLLHQSAFMPEIPVASLPPGLYTLGIVTEDQIIRQKKFVKLHE